MRKNDRSLINVLEEKCQFSSQNFSLPPLFLPFVPGGWKSPWCGLHGRLRPPQIWYNGHVFFLPTAFLLLQIAPLLSHFCPNPPSSPSRIFFVPSLLFSRNLFHFISLPFVEKYRRGNYSENIARNNRGNIRSEVFLFLATVEKSYSLVWGKKYFLLSLWFSRGRRMIKKKERKGRERGRGW